MTVKSVTPIPDHQVIADSRLPAQFAEAPGIYPNPLGGDDVSGWTGTIYSFLSPAQEMEDVLNEMLTERGLLTSEGVNLDRLGEILGQDRAGLTDDDYRDRLVGTIAENNSDGTGNNLLDITSILLGDNLQQIDLIEIFPAKTRIDYFVDVLVEVTEDNNTYELGNITDGQPNVAFEIPIGVYFPGAFDTVIQGVMADYWQTTVPVSYDAATRIYTFHLDQVTMINPPAPALLVLQTSAPLFGFTDPTTINAVEASGSAVPGPTFDPISLEEALSAAKAAGVGVSSTRVIVDNYFGFAGDILSQGFSAQLGAVTIGGGNYSTLFT